MNSEHSPEQPPKIELKGLQAIFAPIERMPDRWVNRFLFTSRVTMVASVILMGNHYLRGDIWAATLGLTGLINSIALAIACDKPTEPENPV